MVESCTKTIRISIDALDLLEENEIKNISQFISEMIIESLQDRKWWKRILVNKISELRVISKKAGYKDIHIKIEDEETKSIVTI